MAVISVTKDNFEEIKNSGKTVLLDFYADWCGPCKMVSPIVDQIADEHPEYVVGKVNVDEEDELSGQYGVMSIPTVIAFENGEIKNKAIGLKSKQEYVALVKG